MTLQNTNSESNYKCFLIPWLYPMKRMHTFSTTKYCMKFAKPSDSHTVFQLFSVTRFPNHWWASSWAKVRREVMVSNVVAFGWPVKMRSLWNISSVLSEKAVWKEISPQKVIYLYMMRPQFSIAPWWPGEAIWSSLLSAYNWSVHCSRMVTKIGVSSWASLTWARASFLTHIFVIPLVDTKSLTAKATKYVGMGGVFSNRLHTIPRLTTESIIIFCNLVTELFSWIHHNVWNSFDNIWIGWTYSSGSETLSSLVLLDALRVELWRMLTTNVGRNWGSSKQGKARLAFVAWNCVSAYHLMKHLCKRAFHMSIILIQYQTNLPFLGAFGVQVVGPVEAQVCVKKRPGELSGKH